jgi:hypothetical protein
MSTKNYLVYAFKEKEVKYGRYSVQKKEKKMFVKIYKE